MSREVIERVQVGPTEYRVYRVNGLHDGNQKLDGQILCGERAIKLEASLDTQSERVTLWHEILHAILTQAGHNNPQAGEGIVEALSFGIIDVLRQNPALREVAE